MSSENSKEVFQAKPFPLSFIYIPDIKNSDYNSQFREKSCTSIDWLELDNEIDLSFQSNNDEDLNYQQSEIINSVGKNKWYENSISFPYDRVTVTTATSTESCDMSITSAGNASIDTLDTLAAYQLDADETEYSYRGPKVLYRNETPATICTANTIGLIRSRKLLRVLLDSGSNACLINRSALPKGIIPKELSNKKSFRTLAGTLSASQIVTLRMYIYPNLVMIGTLNNKMPSYLTVINTNMI